MKKVAIALVLLIAAVLLLNFFIPKGEGRCEKILLKEMKDDCYLALAREMNNSAFCSRIENPPARDLCITQLGAQPGGATDCERLSDPALRDQCLRSLVQTTKNTSYCEGLPGVLERDMCYSTFANNNDDPTACAGISTDYLRMSCNNNIYTKLAISRSNPSLCNQLVYNESELRPALVDRCILEVATQNNDTSLCAGISNSALMQQCITGRIDFSVCEDITDSNQRSSCIFSLAVQSNDPDLCNRVPTPYLRDNCFYQISTTKRDRSICDRIAGENLRSICKTGG